MVLLLEQWQPVLTQADWSSPSMQNKTTSPRQVLSSQNDDSNPKISNPSFETQALLG
jgi:hypothetical protein